MTFKSLKSNIIFFFDNMRNILIMPVKIIKKRTDPIELLELSRANQLTEIFNSVQINS